MNDTINYECEEFIGIDIDVVERIDISLDESVINEYLEDQLRELIYENYDEIIKTPSICEAVQPCNNIYTKCLLSHGYDQKAAFIQSLCMLMFITKKLIF